MNDELGDRMKGQYEDRARYSLPRRTYTIVRIDGKAFHSYTKNLQKPFDINLINDMDGAVLEALPQMQGARFAYIQSDEISILLTDFATPTTCAWFDGNVQKICSVSASLITSTFNRRRWLRPFGLGNPMACFDARVFTIPDPTEVYNYFVWRNQDAARNSLQMVARSLYSHKELQDKNCSEIHEMVFAKGINWADYDKGLKNGRLIIKEVIPTDMTVEFVPPDGGRLVQNYKTNWKIENAPIFTQNPEELKKLIPLYE